MQCVSFRKQFGDRYRVALEESYHAGRGDGARVDDPALQIIPGASGHVFPRAGSLLAVATHGSGTVAKRLRVMPYITVIQDGSDGINATFPVEHLEEVADLIRARRRRRLTPEARQRLKEAGVKTRFSNGTRARSKVRPGVLADQVV